MKNKIIVLVVVVIVVAGIAIISQNRKGISPGRDNLIKIGVITPLTGGNAYWGESTRMGLKLAEKDLAKEGIRVQFIIEDGQVDPTVALNAAQKLVNVDHVGAIYSEFNPAAIAVTSFLKDKDILSLYDAAPTSPLSQTPNVYKTYMDYESSCKNVAEMLKEKGIKRVGVLKINLEFGDLCLNGIRSVYPDARSESYNAGETDFHTVLLKLKKGNPEVVFNGSFQPEALASLRDMREMGLRVPFVGITDSISPNIIDEYSSRLEGSILFGLSAASAEFTERLKQEYPDQPINNYQAAALAYIHLKQIARALHSCPKDLECAKKVLDKSGPESILGFKGFNNRIASFDTLIQEWRGGKLVDIK